MEKRVVLVVAFSFVLACGDDDSVAIDAGRDAAVRIDVGLPDSSVRDASMPDVPGPDAGPGGCSVRDLGASIEDSCGGDNICICADGNAFCEGTGTCSVAFGRRYVIAVSGLNLADRRPDGMCWDDPGCGAPDPYVAIVADGALLLTTPAGVDLYEGVYDPPAGVETTIVAGSEVQIDVFDEDVLDDDFAFGCVLRSATAAQLRARDLSCGNETGSMLAVIVPAP